jgi:hypothetical protein
MESGKGKGKAMSKIPNKDIWCYRWHFMGRKIVSDEIMEPRGPLDVIAEICDYESEKGQASGRLIAEAPAMLRTLRKLVLFCAGKGSSQTGNPYSKPEVQDALKVLARARGIREWMDAAD